MAVKAVDSASPSRGHDSVDSTRLPGKATTAGQRKSVPSENATHLDIIDIRQDAIEFDLKDEILSLLKPVKGPKQLPTLLLYNEKGLQIFEEVLLTLAIYLYHWKTYQFHPSQITYLEEYYLTNAEIDVLTRSASEIAQNIQSESMVIELGSGCVQAYFMMPGL